MKQKLIMAALAVSASILPLQVQAATVFSGEGDGFIIPFGPSTQTSTINLTDSGRVDSVIFSFDWFGHTDASDLTATVTHNGVTAILFSGVTGKRVLDGSYSFTETAPTLLNSVVGSVIIDPGTYKLTYTLPGSTFIGQGIAGDWTLSISDNDRLDVGGLTSWSVSGVAAVPEPATWAMMILGFGFVGTALRRRKQQVRVNYSMA